MDEKIRKRKQLHSNKPFKKPAETKPINEDPYPTHQRPTPEECLAVRDDLLALHGFPQQFAKYRKQRLNRSSLMTISGAGAPNDTMKSEPLNDEEESVLDGLIETVLSQNTTEVNSQRAFASLKAAFLSWEAVLAAEPNCIENAIRCGGLAPTKAACIKNILSCLLKKRGKLCLEYLRALTVGEIKAELAHFKGIGPKTVACVLMFHLQQDDFPVDTHVFEIAKAIGWVPPVADRNKTYLHLNRRIPKELKFDLNCLLYTHGKLCHKCTKKRGNKHGKESHDDSCPLLNFCKNSN
ncbi:HhH-GPD domain-containing protein [Cephalotus follicularis]|uniref:HhH-GPD domain-containing protein n=1 Tax=Cephalotus follicularis TaxID=3775 RepID=A0A1Q3BT87_CEPFO|nr:HhH-GPD domain-containing protein [Cephalotus follicularis]